MVTTLQISEQRNVNWIPVHCIKTAFESKISYTKEVMQSYQKWL